MACDMPAPPIWIAACLDRLSTRPALPLPCPQYRGDQDDRMLTEAVAPLLEQLASSSDVASALALRFNMQK